jgi:myosin heavy subunit
VIAVNPYKWYHELYSEEKRAYYSNRLVWEQSSEDPRATMQPHVYEVSALAYKGLALGEGMNQSILVSGESGAG